MTTLLVIVTISIICAFVVYPTKGYKKVKQVKPHKNDTYKMPNVFWDEYNWLSMKIYNMKMEDADTVQARINEFIYKYEQFCDFRTFNDRVGLLLSDYQKKVKSLLNNKHLEHGTSV